MPKRRKHHPGPTPPRIYSAEVTAADVADAGPDMAQLVAAGPPFAIPVLASDDRELLGYQINLPGSRRTMRRWGVTA